MIDLQTNAPAELCEHGSPISMEGGASGQSDSPAGLEVVFLLLLQEGGMPLVLRCTSSALGWPALGL